MDEDLLKRLTPEKISALRKENLFVWALTTQFEVDRRPFTFDLRKYLIPIFASNNNHKVIMKSAQVGLTVYGILEACHKAVFATFQGPRIPLKVAYYLPAKDGIEKFSKDRLNPLIQAIPEYANSLNASGNVDTVLLKQFGESSLYLLYMKGSLTKDSFPFDVLILDEVRLMTLNDIYQVEQRISASPYPHTFKFSTAGVPNDTIDFYFKRSNQQYWHTRCRCSDGIRLAHEFPRCIVKKGKDYVYQCPKCGYYIVDPQDGVYIKHNPSSLIDGWHIHKMMSPFYIPEKLIDEYHQTKNLEEFYNAGLGLPYIEPRGRPIDLQDLVACVDPVLEWDADKSNCFMGVDQRQGQLHLVVAKFVNGKRQLIHAEIIDATLEDYKRGNEELNVFSFLYERMHKYNVRMAVCDHLPDTNSARLFEQAFRGRVFLAHYKDSDKLGRWSDEVGHSMRVRGMSEHGIGVVSFDRYKLLDAAMGYWKRGEVVCPNPRGLIQLCRDDRGIIKPTYVCEDMLFKHITGVVRKEERSEAGRISYRWVNLSDDPHFLHAFAYCMQAMDHVPHDTSFFCFVE